MFELKNSLKNLISATDILVRQIENELKFNVLDYCRSLPYNWDEIMNWPPSEKLGLYSDFILEFQKIQDETRHKWWWEFFQEFDDRFNNVNSAAGIETSAKVVIEENIKPYFEKHQDHNFFKALVFLSKFYKIYKFTFMNMFKETLA